MVDQTTQNDRSSFITILAWILIVMSGFAAFISILQNIMIHTLFPADQMQAAIASTKNSPNIPWFVEFMFNYFRWFVGAFLLLSLSTLVSAIGLLKRKNWARIVFRRLGEHTPAPPVVSAGNINGHSRKSPPTPTALPARAQAAGSHVQRGQHACQGISVRKEPRDRDARLRQAGANTLRRPHGARMALRP